MKTKRILWLVIIGLWGIAQGGDAAMLPNESWNRGKLELHSGIVLEGEINYNWKAEVVRLRLPDGIVKAYSAHQVSLFMYYDDSHNALRTFAVVDFMVKPMVERQVFLEECTTGPMRVYRRLRHQHEPIRMKNPALGGTDQLVYGYLDSFVYYVYDENTWLELDRFAADVWPRMAKEFDGELNHYRTSRNLDAGSTMGRLMLVTQYNALKSLSQAASAPAKVITGTGE